jgi:hypothetical protein
MRLPIAFSRRGGGGGGGQGVGGGGVKRRMPVTVFSSRGASCEQRKAEEEDAVMVSKVNALHVSREGKLERGGCTPGPEDGECVVVLATPAAPKLAEGAGQLFLKSLSISCLYVVNITL